jgi:chorismate mutase
MRIRAVRGAITVESDDADAIVNATAELIREMMKRNEITKEDLVSLIFTATPDLTSEFPAAAARHIGISDIPLLCATEIDVKGSIRQCVRVMMHTYTEKDYDALRHVYLGGARQLRTDLPE